MKPEKVYQELKDAAEKIGINVIEKSFRNVGVPVQSGLCKVKERQVFLLDRNLSRREKNELLTACLSQVPDETLEQIFVMPEIRSLIKGK